MIDEKEMYSTCYYCRPARADVYTQALLLQAVPKKKKGRMKLQPCTVVMF